MAFHYKEFWMEKGGGHLTDGETLFDNNASRTDPKRPHEWFADGAEPEIFPQKRQAVESPNSKMISGVPISSLPWENISGFQPVPNQFIDHLLVSETARPAKFTGRNISDGIDKEIADNQLENESSVGLSMSYTFQDEEACLSYGGIRKVKVNQVKDSGSGLLASEDQKGKLTNFMTIGNSYCETEAGHISIGDKGETGTISFGGLPDESEIDAFGSAINSYGYIKDVNRCSLSYDQSSVQTLHTPGIKELDASNAIVGGSTTQLGKSKSRSEPKLARKEAPNSFPSNVKSLIATGMLDGVPVKYVSLSREELQGIIKGSGYLCGCPSCNFSKALNAYEFERHAGCKTKHPNNHIYFENGKTIYQIVQELRSTPGSLLFDAIQTVTGSPINQKAFRSWKESFQAATRELQRIYGKEELNL